MLPALSQARVIAYASLTHTVTHAAPPPSLPTARRVKTIKETREEEAEEAEAEEARTDPAFGICCTAVSEVLGLLVTRSVTRRVTPPTTSHCGSINWH